MMLTLMLTSKGVAGVPRAALVILTATLSSFGLPLEGAAILLGIDQLLDMGRTAVNVMGNCIATVVVARWEGAVRQTSSGRRIPARRTRGRTRRVVVAGAAGQLGQAIVGRLSGGVRGRRAHSPISICASHEPLSARRSGSAPDAIVNCAAYNAVDQAEDDVSTALDGNAFGVQARSRGGATSRRDPRALQHRLRLRRRSQAAVHGRYAPARRGSVYGQLSCSANALRATRRGIVLQSREPVRRPKAQEQHRPDHRSPSRRREARVFTIASCRPSFVG